MLTFLIGNTVELEVGSW